MRVRSRAFFQAASVFCPSGAFRSGLNTPESSSMRPPGPKPPPVLSKGLNCAPGDAVLMVAQADPLQGDAELFHPHGGILVQLVPPLSNYPKTLSSSGFYGGYTPFSDSC